MLFDAPVTAPEAWENICGPASALQKIRVKLGVNLCDTRCWWRCLDFHWMNFDFPAIKVENMTNQHWSERDPLQSHFRRLICFKLRCICKFINSINFKVPSIFPKKTNIVESALFIMCRNAFGRCIEAVELLNKAWICDHIELASLGTCSRFSE